LALAGVIPISSGSVRVSGVESGRRDRRALSRVIASVPQKTEVSFPFKCLSLVLMGRYPHLDWGGAYSAADIDIALQEMERTGTLRMADRPVNEVSGGEAQMVTIARALAQRSDILLLDEATSNLDVARKIEVFDVLAEKNRGGATLLCVMHDLNLAALYCKRLIFLKSGNIVLDGKTEDVFNDHFLSEIYETEIRVSRHPVTGGPQAHFVPGGNRDSRVGAVAGVGLAR
jgi:iron complex transport system ATP-binding protein